jgi:cytoskeletal protein CcmA (bactofilin family)
MSMIYDELKNAEQLRHGGSHIRAGLKIKGEISGTEDLLADGIIEGPVTLTGAMLRVGETGSITGNVAANAVVVHGTVSGNVEARDMVKIAPSGSITGDIVTSRIGVDDGARCKGSIDVGRKQGSPPPIT